MIQNLEELLVKWDRIKDEETNPMTRAVVDIACDDVNFLVGAIRLMRDERVEVLERIVASLKEGLE